MLKELRLQTSDVGEAFRPVVHPYIVTGAYAVSWAYLAGYVHILLLHSKFSSLLIPN